MSFASKDNADETKENKSGDSEDQPGSDVDILDRAIVMSEVGGSMYQRDSGASFNSSNNNYGEQTSRGSGEDTAKD